MVWICPLDSPSILIARVSIRVFLAPHCSKRKKPAKKILVFSCVNPTYSNNVYWTDQGTFSIGVASLEAALKGQIKSNKRLYTSKYLGVPRYIAVDPIRRALYWSERQDDWERIHKSDILGKSQDIIWHEFGTLDIGSISVELRSVFN